MLFYHGRTYHAASIGVRIVDVCCEKCATKFYYELARVGKGASTASYGIGGKKAASSSQVKASANLEVRLSREAELVPCPKCFWINEELVAGYRRGSYRVLTRLALIVAFFGTFISVLVGLMLARGPAVDRDAVPDLQYVGPGISIGLGLLLVLTRKLLQARIEPNEVFPLPPTIPTGSPRPLLKNPVTGDLEPAPPLPGQEISRSDWLDFQIGRIDHLPMVCSSCLGQPDPRSALQRPLDLAVTLTIPLCRSCRRKALWTGWKYAAIFLLIGSAWIVPVLMIYKVDEILFWFTIGMLGTMGPTLGAFFASYRTSPIRLKFVDKSRGIFRIRFRNEDYRKLVVNGQLVS